MKEQMSFLKESWSFDVNGDFNLTNYNYTRRPVLVKATLEIDDESRPIYFVSLHTKSKFIQSGKSLWDSNNPFLQMNYIRKSIKNRRRIASECNRTRKMIDDVLLEENPEAYILVAGDMNDGPGYDFFETFYLLFDSVERLMGSPFNQKKLLRAAILEHSNLTPELLFTTVFDDYVDKIKNKRCLLDHIFISNNLDSICDYCGIVHDLWNQFSNNDSPERKDRLSDHRPIFTDFQIKHKKKLPEDIEITIQEDKVKDIKITKKLPEDIEITIQEEKVKDIKDKSPDIIDTPKETSTSETNTTNNN